MTQQKFDKLAKKDSAELIVYQIGEVKNLLENLGLKMENYQDKTDRRITALELFQATEEAKAKVLRDAQHTEPKIDIQKIVLTAFGVIGTLAAIIQFLLNKGV